MTLLALLLFALSAENYSPLVKIKEGFKAYGLKDLLLNHSELYRHLFIKRPVKAFHANYLSRLFEPEFINMGTPERIVEDQVVDNF